MLVAGLSKDKDANGRLKVRAWVDDASVNTVTTRWSASGVAVPGSVQDVALPPILAAHPHHPRKIFEIGDLPPDSDITLEAGSHSARIRTLPDSDQPLRLVLGSCYYGMSGVDSQAAMPNGPQLAYATLQDQPHLKILCGDQVYLDSGSLGNGSVSREEATFRRYYDYIAAYGGYLSSGLHVFAPDDHEYWNDYPNAMLWLRRSFGDKWVEHGRAAILANTAFQTITNPGAESWFELDLGLVSLFVSDLRTERSTEGRGRLFWDAGGWHEGSHGRRLCSTEQIDAIGRWAGGLDKPGLLVVAQPLFQGPEGTADQNLLAYPNEARAIWAAVEQAPRSIAVLSGDIHYSRASYWGPADLTKTRFEVVGSPMRLLKPFRIGPIAFESRKGASKMTLPAVAVDATSTRSGHQMYATSADAITTIELRDAGLSVEMRIRAHHAKPGAPVATDAHSLGRQCDQTFHLF